jgi:PRC-barrel domain
MTIINLEMLIGRKVVDANGKPVGRIEEFVATRRGADLVVTEVYVGRRGLAERLSARGAAMAFIRFFGGRSQTRKPQRIKWGDLDLSDPERPRLKR